VASVNPNLRDVVLVKNTASAIANHGQVKEGQGDELVRASERGTRWSRERGRKMQRVSAAIIHPLSRRG